MPETDEIVIKKNGDRGTAYDGEKSIANSKCRSCVVKILLSVTKNSERYKSILVYDDKDELAAVHRTGVENAR